MKPNIAFVTGGYSTESVISYKSAVTIEKNIDRDKYNVYTIDITPGGWFCRVNDQEIPVDKSDFTVKINGTIVKFDAVLIGIHGTPGEDGKLQGYFDLLNLPYTSCDAATSALTFNKRYTVAVAAFAGISVARSLHLFKENPLTPEAILKELSLPVFVKPNNGGSSIGMSKVNVPGELSIALDKAFKEDDQVLVEEFIKGREFTVGVFKTRGEVIVLPITEVIANKEFFDYEAKYTTGIATEVTPAEIPDAIAGRIRQDAGKIYKLFNCRGVVRMDFIYNEGNGSPYLLEINTVPGQSEFSIVPQQVRAFNWTLKSLYSALIEEALLSAKK